MRSTTVAADARDLVMAPLPLESSGGGRQAGGRSEIVDAYRRTGKDFSIGRRIGRMLREAGLEDVRIRPTARATQVGEYYQTFRVSYQGGEKYPHLVRDAAAPDLLSEITKAARK